MTNQTLIVRNGREYGHAFADSIERNLKILVWREGYEPLPREDPDFIDWFTNQERLIEKHWPWLIEEMVQVAHGANVKYEDILLLNLRAWQYSYYGATPQMGGCSSLAITLADGAVACAGALDDPIEYYCGPVRVHPAHGHPFITFPLTGSSWASRGMNSRGLSVGISSQILPGLLRLDHAVNQDLAVRVILQTCATTDEVREFCRVHPFTMNLVVVDARGQVLCAQHTASGLFEMPSGTFAALTNHVAEDRLVYELEARGVTELPEIAASRLRRGRLLSFIDRRNGRCTAAEVRAFIAQRDDADPGSNHHAGTIYLTFSNPQSEPTTFWVMQPKADNRDFRPLEVL